MQPLEVEIAKRKLRDAKEARGFYQFYRNILKPVLQYGVMNSLSKGVSLTDEQLRTLRSLAQSTEDIEIIMKRIIIEGINIDKAINDKINKEKGG